MTGCPRLVHQGCGVRFTRIKRIHCCARRTHMHARDQAVHIIPRAHVYVLLVVRLHARRIHMHIYMRIHTYMYTYLRARARMFCPTRNTQYIHVYVCLLLIY